MRHRLILPAILILLAAPLLLAQSAYVPTYVYGGGISYGNPGFGGSVDFDAHLSANLYAHTAVSNVVLKNKTISATVRPGFEYRFWQSATGNTTLVAEADGGVSVGSTTTLSAFTGGGYVALDACNSIKTLNRFGHCFVELGGAVMGGSVVSTTTGQPVQLVPTLKLRFGAN